MAQGPSNVIMGTCLSMIEANEMTLILRSDVAEEVDVPHIHKIQ